MALVLTAAQMQRADRWAIETLGVPGLVLMENAGRGVARMILRRLAEHGPGPEGKPALVAVVCGAGNNAGDGFVIARHLSLSGARVQVLLALPRAKIAGDAAINLAALERMGGVDFVDLSGESDPGVWQARLAQATIIVDAIFGTGLRSDVTGVPLAAIQAINSTSGALRVAVDLPSGLDADTGAVRGVAVQADVTGTMAAHKSGLLLNPVAPVGRIQIVDLGVPLHAPDDGGPYMHLIDQNHVRALLPRQTAHAHKGSRGHVLVVAGSAGKTGAAVLAASGALRAGAGLCTVASTRAGQQALDAKIVEIMSACYTDGDDAGPDSATRLEGLLGRMAAAAIGPGIPTGPAMKDLVIHLAGQAPVPLVIDADGLNHLAGTTTVLRNAPAPRILTPHPGEAARLLGIQTRDVQADRLGTVRRLASDCNAVVVLKGARTLIAHPDGTVYINPAANPALATAGSGDVLTGVIAGLLAQGLPALDAVVAGVFAHGQAAEDAATALGTHHLVASDLPLAVARWMDGPESPA